MGDFLLGEKPAEIKPGEMQQMMMDRARGLGTSAAELMMDRGMQQQISAGRSMAAGARGVSPGLAMRQAGRRESQAMSNVGQQTGILRAQEQAMALRSAQQAELQQQMYNASRRREGGMLAPLMQLGGQLGAAAIGMPWGSNPEDQSGWSGQQFGGGYNPWAPEVTDEFDFGQI